MKRLSTVFFSMKSAVLCCEHSIHSVVNRKEYNTLLFYVTFNYILATNLFLTRYKFSRTIQNVINIYFYYFIFVIFDKKNILLDYKFHVFQNKMTKN